MLPMQNQSIGHYAAQRQVYTEPTFEKHWEQNCWPTAALLRCPLEFVALNHPPRILTILCNFVRARFGAEVAEAFENSGYISYL